MKTDTTFVRANGIIELHTIAQVGLHFALVVHPCHTECEDTVGLHQALDNFCFLEFGMLVVHVFYGKKNFLHGLKVLGFARMLSLQRGHNTFDVHNIWY